MTAGHHTKSSTRVWSGVLRVLGGNAGGLDVISHGNGGSILIKQNGSVRTFTGLYKL